jgi:protease I
MEKIAFIISSRDFRDEEYFITKEVLENKGFKVDTYSDKVGLAIGKFGGEVGIDKDMGEISVDSYVALVIVGGSGALEHLDGALLHEIVAGFDKSGKIVAAICISPVILANSGIMEGKKSTVWSSPIDKSAIGIIEKSGAVYVDESVVVDGNIITGRDYLSSTAFGEAIASSLI